MNNPNEQILLTEDGHPIGEIVMADNKPTAPVPTAEDEVEADRAEELRVRASEVLCEPDADKAVAELYPGYCNPEKRKTAMTLFVVEQKAISEVAKIVGVPERTVSMWSYDGKWIDLVEKELAVRQAQSRVELARLRADRRAKVAKAQLDAAEMIRDKVTGELNDMSAKSAAEALKSAADVEARILGIKETGETAEASSSEEKKKADGKVPLVVVFNNTASGIPTLRRTNADS